MNQKEGIEFAVTPPLSTGVRLHYAEGGDTPVNKGKKRTGRSRCVPVLPTINTLASEG